MSDAVLIALIGNAASIIAAVAALTAAKRSGQAKDQSAAAVRASSAAAQNAATAVTNTAPISDGFATHIQDELRTIKTMVMDHINNREIHGR